MKRVTETYFCPDCRGKGTYPGLDITCRACHGSGERTSDTAAEPCEKCGVLQRERDAAVVSEARLEAELASARTEATAEAYARCRQLAASIRLPVVVDDEGKGWQRGVEAVIRKISTANPDPDYRSRIRGEVLESVVRLCIAHAKVVDTDAERNLANLIASEVHALKETIPNE